VSEIGRSQVNRLLVFNSDIDRRFMTLVIAGHRP
jgi:hypothetical protein